MMKRFEIIALCVLLMASVCSSYAAAEPSKEDSDWAFKQIQSLEGEWEGTAQWTGAREGSYPLNARYYLSGRVAIVESIVTDGKVNMTSVYFIDRDELRVDHYCMVNQPRLRMTGVDRNKAEVRFVATEVGNLSSPSAGHVSAIGLELHGDRDLVVAFTFTAAGKDAYERIKLRRVSPKK